MQDGPVARSNSALIYKCDPLLPHNRSSHNPEEAATILKKSDEVLFFLSLVSFFFLELLLGDTGHPRLLIEMVPNEAQQCWNKPNAE